MLVMTGNTKMKAYYREGSCTPSRDLGVDWFGCQWIAPTIRQQRTEIQLGSEGVDGGWQHQLHQRSAPT